MNSRFPLIAAVAAALAGGTVQAQMSANAFIAAASPSQEFPNNPTIAPGAHPSCLAGFRLAGPSLRFTIRCNNITGVTLAHIHGGTADASGAPIVTVYGGPTTGAVNGVLIAGTITADDVGGRAAFDDLIEAMTSDNTYFNIHTTANGGGEVRGQIVPFRLPVDALFNF